MLDSKKKRKLLTEEIKPVNLKKLRVIVLLSEHPYPPNSGTKVKNYHLWKNFLKFPDIELKVLYLSDTADLSTFSGHEEITLRYDKFNIVQKSLRYLLYSHHQYRYSSALGLKLQELSQQWNPDIIHAEELKMAKYAQPSKIKKTVTLHNVESDLIKKSGSLPVRYFQKILNFIHSLTLKNYESRVVQTFDKIFTYSDVDTKRFRQLYKQQSFVTTRNGVNAQAICPSSVEQTNNILFVGSLHYAPNAEGIKWFLQYVRPYLRKDITITVAGAGAPNDLKKLLKESHIIFYDSPKSLEDFYHRCTLTIVPLLNGSGTRTKILESLAYQRPIVSTIKGSEGLSVNESMAVYNRDDPKEFAETINHLCHKDQIAELKKRSEVGREYILKNYDWEVLADQYYEQWKSL